MIWTKRCDWRSGYVPKMFSTASQGLHFERWKLPSDSVFGLKISCVWFVQRQNFLVGPATVVKPDLDLMLSLDLDLLKSRRWHFWLCVLKVKVFKHQKEEELEIATLYVTSETIVHKCFWVEVLDLADKTYISKSRTKMIHLLNLPRTTQKGQNPLLFLR